MKKENKINQTNKIIDSKKNEEDFSKLNNEQLLEFLEKRAKELGLVIPKCARCVNPCGKCKMNFLKKEEKNITIKNSVINTKN